MLSLLQQVIQECFVSTRVANIELKPSRLLSSLTALRFAAFRALDRSGPIRRGGLFTGKKGGAGLARPEGNLSAIPAPEP